MKQAVMGALYESGAYQQLHKAIRGGVTPCSAFEVCESRRIHLCAGLALDFARPMLIVTHNDIRAQRVAQDMEALTGEPVPVFPSRNLSLRRVTASGRDFSLRRIAVLSALSRKAVRIVVCAAETISEPTAPPEVFRNAVISIEAGQAISIKELTAGFVQAGYERVERVESMGSFTVRGGIVDIFPCGEEQPVRMEFFGNEIDTLRRYDVQTQRSGENLSKIEIYPARETPIDDDAMRRLTENLQEVLEEDKARLRKLNKEEPPNGKVITPPAEKLAKNVDDLLGELLINGSFEGEENHMKALYGRLCGLWDYMEDPLIIFDEPSRIQEAMDERLAEHNTAFREAFEAGEALSYQKDFFCDRNTLYERLKNYSLLSLQDIDYDNGLKDARKVNFSGREINPYKGKIEHLAADINGWKKQKYRILIFSGTQTRAKRLRDALLDLNTDVILLEKDRPVMPGEAVILSDALHNGFEDVKNRLVLLGESEAFGTMAVKKPVSKAAQKRGLELFTDLTPGDFVVHEAHGIGVFKGVVKLTADGHIRDYVQVEYQKGDMLYVPTESMNRVEKYIGSEGHEPRLSRLGGGEWERQKGKVKEKVRDLAEGLIKLYARREASRGIAFKPDDEFQRTFEEEFPFEETPDQISAIADIKEDMESDSVMDRLLCGDVGYGKTEVALRAAYKAILSGTQVAFLAPTTVLTYQHYNTICSRFANTQVRFDMLSRFRTKAEQQEIIEKLNRGELDLVVGTHRLLSKDIHFKKLGLLIVDEEQRFGVAHKEKIKEIKENVDVLMMSATPIPRTLNMSLNGIRDISIIETAPEQRRPVQTYVLEYDEQLIRDAILRELNRGGQVYFLYNMVESMPVFYRNLKELVPEARIISAHGQMESNELEQAMLDFYDGKYDVLLSTTIIENGLDVSRANTLIVYDSDRFGLSQLYQLRGRVGRSTRLAYAYFTFRRNRALNETAEKRLTAIREFTELGSGFKIAMRDLEIRGAGNLLGAEQHGQMATVGYALYCRIIDEAVKELRGEAVESNDTDTHLEIQVDAYIPDSYIAAVTDRLEAYKRISRVESEQAKSDVVDEFVDRYGEPPQSVLNLMDVAWLKNLASQCGLETIRQRQANTTLRFEKTARMDPSMIMQLIFSYRGALTMGSGEVPILTYTHLGHSWKEYNLELRALLEKISLCKSQLN